MHTHAYTHTLSHLLPQVQFISSILWKPRTIILKIFCIHEFHIFFKMNIFCMYIDYVKLNSYNNKTEVKNFKISVQINAYIVFLCCRLDLFQSLVPRFQTLLQSPSSPLRLFFNYSCLKLKRRERRHRQISHCSETSPRDGTSGNTQYTGKNIARCSHQLHHLVLEKRNQQYNLHGQLYVMYYFMCFKPALLLG